MTGQVIYQGVSLGHPTPKEDKASLPNKSTRLIFAFSDKSKLYFNDQRKFGWVKLLNKTELVEFQKNLGIDLLSPKFTPNFFYNQLQSSYRVIKQVLLDQSKFAGVGNIYANDALFLSQIHPQTISNQISLSQSKILRHHLIKIIKESISQGGSTAKDNKYIRPDGNYGQHQFHFWVYQREGKTCLKCKSLIKKIKIGSRGTFYRPQCQKPLVK
jgi:formamidopyrimidine-DNA glycosylase